MYIAHVVTSWLIESDGNRVPALARQHSNIFSCTDITGQPSQTITPAPNAFTVEVVAEGSVMDAIEANTGAVILWLEELPDADT